MEWVSYEFYTVNYPGELSAEQFARLAEDARLRIMELTHWRADMLDQYPEESREDVAAILRDCQAAVISHLVWVEAYLEKTGGGAVSSASNDGYSERFSSGRDIAAQADNTICRMITRRLNHPLTRWMIYRGGVYSESGR